jgi:hypothetical protein
MPGGHHSHVTRGSHAYLWHFEAADQLHEIFLMCLAISRQAGFSSRRTSMPPKAVCPPLWKAFTTRPSPAREAMFSYPAEMSAAGRGQLAKDAWPNRGHLHLDGFSFNHLGGIEGETGPEMRTPGMDWWVNWARRDSDYSPAPYAQLAGRVDGTGRPRRRQRDPLPRPRAGTRDRKGIGLRLVWIPSMGRWLRYRHLHLPSSLLGHRHLIPRRPLSKDAREGAGAREPDGGRLRAADAQLFCIRSKTKGEMRLDDNEIRISGARRTDVTGVGAMPERKIHNIKSS